MATAFINASFQNLTRDAGACRLVAYLGRTAIADQRLGLTYDFTDIAHDLVHAEIRLPDIAPAEFGSVDKLANLIDEADARRMRTTQRERWPQYAAALIAALPPDDELSFDEAIEFIERVVIRIVGRNRLAVITAVHDPRLTTPGARNRHAHITVVLREVDRDGFGKKVRNLFAHARRSPGAKHYVAEGVHWPRLSFEMQQSFFAELATDTVVDPPAPYSERRWSPTTLRTDPVLVLTHRRIVQNQNLDMIGGPPGTLVDRLLRGRGAMLVEELRHLLKRFIDREADRELHLDRILADADVITLARNPAEQHPSRLTTRTVYDTVLQATGIIDRACAARDASGGTVAERLTVVSQGGAKAVIRDLSTLARRHLQGFHQRPLLVGTKSDCEVLAENLAAWRPIVASTPSLLKTSVPSARGSPKRAGIRRRGLVVVARSESVDDQDLAAILVAADAKQATVVLGYDESHHSGVAGPRLAAYAADALAPPHEDADDPRWIERQLRAGRVDRAVAAMHARGQIYFAAGDDMKFDEAPEFLVCDDTKRLRLMNESLSAAHEESGALEPGTAVGPTHLALQLRKGQWIAVTQTDYTTLPPAIRAGQIAQVMDLLSDRQTIRVQLRDGAVQDIDLAKHPHVRSAFAVSIREARHAPSGSTILIEMTQPRHAWAAILLAAARIGGARVRVDSALADNVEALIRVVRSSLPGALPSELRPRKDPEADMAAVLAAATIGTMSTTPASDAQTMEQEWFEPMATPQPVEAEPATTASQHVAPPVPAHEPTVADDIDAAATSRAERAADPNRAHQTGSAEPPPNVDEDFEMMPTPQPPLPAEVPRHLHEDLRAILAAGDPRTALALLQATVGTDAIDGDRASQYLLQLCAPEGPTAALIRTLMVSRTREHPESILIRIR